MLSEKRSVRREGLYKISLLRKNPKGESHPQVNRNEGQSKQPQTLRRENIPPVILKREKMDESQKRNS